MTVRPARQDLLRTSAPGSPVAFTGHEAHSHDHPLLIHVVTGSVVIDVERRGGSSETIAADSGSGVWIGTGIDHAVTPHRDSILIGPRVSIEPPAGVLPLVDATEVHELALLILASAPRTKEDKQRFRTSLDAVLAALTVDDFPVPAPTDPLIRQIVEDPHALILPLSDLARSQALSPRHIERLFRADLGLSYVQWRTRQRLNQALRRIRAGAPVRSAARAVGYDSADGLIKAAQRQTGLDRRRLVTDLAGAVDAWRGSLPHASGSQPFPSCTV